MKQALLFLILTLNAFAQFGSGDGTVHNVDKIQPVSTSDIFLNAPVKVPYQTTPSNPIAGHVKFYFKSDNILYVLDSAGNEEPVGVLNLTSTNDNRLIKTVGTNGDELEETGIIVDDSDNVTGIEELTLNTSLLLDGASVLVKDTVLGIADLFAIESDDGLENYFSVSGVEVRTDLNIEMNGTGLLKLPAGTEAQRPDFQAYGMRGNTDETCIEWYNGTDWECLGAGGGGSSGINIVSDFSFENEELLPDNSGFGTVSYETYTANDELGTEFNEKYYEVVYGSPLTNADLYVRDTFTRTGLDNKAGVFSIWIKALVADGESLKLCVRIDDPDYSEACESYLEVPIIGDDTWNEYKIPIVYGASSVEYEIYDEDYSGSTAIAVDLVEFKVGNELGTINESDTDSQPYSPTLVGFGTTANENFEFSRIGDKLVISGRFDCGTPAATEAQIPLPNGIQVKSGLPLKGYGTYYRGNASRIFNGGAVLASGGNSYINLSSPVVFSNTAVDPLVLGDGNEVCGSGDVVSFTTAPIPIQEWKTGRVNAFSQRREDTADNSNTIVSVFDGSEGASIDVKTESFEGAITCGYTSTGIFPCTINTDLDVIPSVSCNTINDRICGIPTATISTTGFTVHVTQASTPQNHDFTVTLEKQGDDRNSSREVTAQLNVNQIKGACFNTTYSETEIECGERGGETLYRTCFTGSFADEDILVSSVSKLVNTFGEFNATGSRWFYFPYNAGGGSTFAGTERDASNNIVFESSATFSANFCVDYTR